MKEESYQWWQKNIIYQIYPRSFKDSDNNGTGDLPGIIEKLDYLKWLGVDCIWISPVYPSPMHDFGYDISDYKGIDPRFGTMNDFDRLLSAAKEKGIRIIMDLVPNHTSDQHPWFLEARRSRNSEKRSWYIWKDPGKGGTVPNNWISEFAGPAWEFDEETEQYYYHTFLKEQPDLNWHNEEVQEAMWDVIRFWFDKGIDGFRIDVLWYLIKDEHFRDNPPNPDWHEGMQDHDKLIPAFSNDQPYVHELVEKMRKISEKEYKDKVLIGEIYLPFHKLVTYYNKGKGVHLPFNFSLISTEWKAKEIYSTIAEYEGALSDGDWPNWVMSNHDKPRVKSRIGAGQVRNAAILLLTLRGTPTMYYGDEIGMADVTIPKDRFQDPRAILEPDINVGRDPQRTPMQWNDEKHAGFSNSKPWLPVDSVYKKINVKSQQQDENSLLWLYKRLINLRNNEPALYIGDYIPAGIQNDVIAYIRKYENDRFLIAVNLSNQKEEFIPDFSFTGKIIIASNHTQENKEVMNKLKIDGNDGLVIRLE
ncbi:MAG: alpha-amylase family glycosyl hydrolase [Fulvivirga sp.]